MKVLIADDEDLTRRMLDKHLTKWGYEVISASDGCQAWALLQSDSSIQIAILDWVMPGIQGIELARRIKTELTRPVYLVLLTVNSQTEDLVLGLEAGADEYVSKPFDKRELRARLKAGERVIQLENSLTERVRELEEAEEKLKRSNRDLDAFAYIASHDLQEPLRKVQVFSGRLMKACGNSLPEKATDYLDRMVDAVKRMDGLIQDLLTLSRVTTSTRDPEPVDLNGVVKEVLGDLEVRIERSRGEVSIGALPTVLANPLQMRQLLQNLIGNALKFCRPDSHPVVKVYSEETAGPWARITVEDHGIGFDDKYIDQIFLPFKRLNLGEYEGSGIGLSICRRIADRHNGTITAQSEKGKGSKFIVTLPVYVPPPAQLSAIS